MLVVLPIAFHASSVVKDIEGANHLTKKLNIMRENAIKLIHSEYAWDKILSKYNKMYQEAKKI